MLWGTSMKDQGSSGFLFTAYILGFPGGSDGKGSACNAGDLSLIPGFEDPLKEGMATYSSILAWRIPMDSGAWRATVTESWTHAAPLMKCSYKTTSL